MKDQKTNQIITRFRDVHGNKYDYTDVVYQGYKIPVTINCREHGSFSQRPDVHLRGSGCKECSRLALSHTKESFVDKANKVHDNRYSYQSVIYTNVATRVLITCPKHGDFFQTPRDHLSGYGCMECGRARTVAAHQKDTNQFINDARRVHGNVYDYSKSIYMGTLEPIEIICPKHGSFFQKPNYHVNAKTGCPKCIQSHHERQILTFLEERDIIFETEYKITENGKKLRYRYDFYVPMRNLLIEYDGQHHFEPVRFNGIDLKRAKQIHLATVQRDRQKNTLASKHGYDLVRITYYDNINDTLTKLFW